MNLTTTELERLLVPSGGEFSTTEKNRSQIFLSAWENKLFGGVIYRIDYTDFRDENTKSRYKLFEKVNIIMEFKFKKKFLKKDYSVEYLQKKVLRCIIRIDTAGDYVIVSSFEVLHSNIYDFDPKIFFQRWKSLNKLFKKPKDPVPQESLPGEEGS